MSDANKAIVRRIESSGGRYALEGKPHQIGLDPVVIAAHHRAQTAMAATSLAAPGTPSIKRPIILCELSSHNMPSIVATAVTPAAARSHAGQDGESVSE